MRLWPALKFRHAQDVIPAISPFKCFGYFEIILVGYDKACQLKGARQLCAWVHNFLPGICQVTYNLSLSQSHAAAQLVSSGIPRMSSRP